MPTENATMFDQVVIERLRPFYYVMVETVH